MGLAEKVLCSERNGSSPPDGQESFFKEGRPVLFFWTNKVTVIITLHVRVRSSNDLVVKPANQYFC